MRNNLNTMKEKNENSNIIDIREKYKEKHNKKIEDNQENKNNHNKNKNKNNKKQNKISFKTVFYISTLSIFLGFIIWSLVHKNAYEIYISDIPVGIVKVKDEGLEKTIYNTALSQIETKENTKIKPIEDYQVTSKFIRASKKDLSNPDYIISQVRDKISYNISAFVISVNDVEIGTLKNKEDIELVLNKILDKYTINDSKLVEINKTFIENYTITPKFVDKSIIITQNDLFNKLTAETEISKTYEVKEKDTLWNIAKDNGIPLSTIYKLNPDVTETSILKIGQKLKLVVPKPFLSVKVVTEMKYIETIPYSVEYQTDDEQLKTYQMVVQEGKEGSKEITTHITYINGYEDDKEIIGEPTILLEPIPSIIVTGTKSIPPKSSTGSFIRPISGGNISSYFGSRWGSFHSALDISAPKGTTIYASDGGVVTFSGWKAGFGNLVIINHDNGFETYYAHCSRLDVNSGQRVAKGENIAAVGSTGNSTGNHIHFEIHKNNVPVNPLNYIK